MACILCLCCGIIAAIIPFVTNCTKDVVHKCRHCGWQLATYERENGLRINVGGDNQVPGSDPTGEKAGAGETSLKGSGAVMPRTFDNEIKDGSGGNDDSQDYF
jgi:LITAF-like zinc ribbon domain